MKFFSWLAFLLIATSIEAQSTKPSEPSGHTFEKATAIAEGRVAQTSQDQPVNTAPSPKTNTNLGSKLGSSGQDTAPTALDIESKWADPMTWLTLVLAVATILLWISTKDLAAEAKRASGIAKVSADAAGQSAEAAVKTAMPVLTPYILQAAQLHPFTVGNETVVHEAKIHIGFDNYGKTPGIIRSVKADLTLTIKDSLPDPVYNTVRDYDGVMIPGNSRATTQHFGALDFVQQVTLSPQELRELTSEAVGEFRRFALIGEVVYDDFFGLRHTSKFCVKLRVWLDRSTTPPTIRQFQLTKGGSKYNSVTSEKIPNPDPYAQA